MDQILDASGAKLSHIPDLKGIREIDLSYNNILHLEARLLPIDLIYLDISHNTIDFYRLDNNSFPATIETLILDCTKIKFFDGHTFLHLTKLSICNCNLINFVFPPYLLELEITDNKLKSLDDLPRSLITLNCSNNELTELPLLSFGLEILKCSHNLLKELPNLPYSINNLDISHNEISKITHLPYYLKSFCANNSGIQDICGFPDLLEELDLDNNYLSSIPYLPKKLMLFTIANNYLWEIKNEEIPESVVYLNLCGNHFLGDLPEALLERKLWGTRILYGELSDAHNIYDNNINTEYMFTDDTNYGPYISEHKTFTDDDPLCVSIYNTTTIIV